MKERAFCWLGWSTWLNGMLVMSSTNSKHTVHNTICLRTYLHSDKVMAPMSTSGILSNINTILKACITKAIQKTYLTQLWVHVLETLTQSSTLKFKVDKSKALVLDNTNSNICNKRKIMKWQVNCLCLNKRISNSSKSKLSRNQMCFKITKLHNN